MNIRYRTASLWAMLFSFVSTSSLCAAQQPEALYKAYCGGCHGAHLEGASATALVKDDWLYGRDGFTMGNNIRHGIAAAGMPAWGKVLSNAQIDALVMYIMASQTSPPEPKPIPAEIKTELYTLKTERLVTEGLSSPWGIEFVDKQRALISENSGKLFWMVGGKLDTKPITGLPAVDLATSTGGLLDVALDPNYQQNGWVYLAYSHSENPNLVAGPGMTRVIRGKIDGYQWSNSETLFSVDKSQHLGNSKHWGGRLLFDREGKLYFSIGDMSQPMDSQALNKPSGKVYRINADGSAPADNPFADNKNAIASIFTTGNRNVQGLAQHPVTGAIWASEHGPQGGDELNILQEGKNYGWPVVTYGVNYDGSIISELTHKEGMEQPVTQWTPALAVSPIEFVSSAQFPRWQNDLLLGSLAFEELRRLVIDGSTVKKQEVLFKGFGRIRDVKVGPDGAVYILLNNPGEVVRLTASNNS